MRSLLYYFGNSLILLPTLRNRQDFTHYLVYWGQTGLYVSGQFLSNLANINQYFALQCNLSLLLDHVLSIQIILITVLILGIIALFIFWLLNHKIFEAFRWG